MKGLYALGSLMPCLGNRVWIAPTAAVIGHVVLHDDVSIWFGAVIRGDQPEPVIVNARTNIQDGAVLHSDAGVPLTIGTGVTVGHQAMLHGCTVGDNCLIGIGSTILNHAVIGENSIVGAGALVTEGKQIPPNSLVVGAPAKVVRQLTDTQVESLRQSAAYYVDNAERFAAELRPDDGKEESSFDARSKL